MGSVCFSYYYYYYYCYYFYFVVVVVFKGEWGSTSGLMLIGSPDDKLFVVSHTV